MSARMDELAARKSLLVAQLRLQRMEFALHAGDVRSSLRPAGLIGSAVAPVFGLQRYARWVRLASIAFAVTRIARKWRQSTID
jgi:hypothetical protein